MSDLVAFLRARLDEDEEVARAALIGGLGAWSSVRDYAGDVHIRASHRLSQNGPAIMNLGPEALPGSRKYGPHIIRHDPDRVLREVEAKRRIVEVCAPPLVEVTGLHDSERSFIPGEGPPWGEPVLRLLALPYSDHFDYRSEWRP